MLTIKRLWAREIFTSQAWPTIECYLELSNGFIVMASVPSGTSRSMYEAYELVDGGTRLMGRGVLSAIESIEEGIAPLLIGKEPHVLEMDLAMLTADGTQEMMRLGANATLAVSIALCRAQALVEGLEVFECIARLMGSESVSVPFPLFNMINGGAHAPDGASIQEVLAVPANATSFHHALEAGVVLYHVLEQVLREEGFSTATGAEGGFVPLGVSDDDALDLLARAIARTEMQYGYSFFISLDVAAQQLYDSAAGKYKMSGGYRTREELVEWYASLCQRYRMYSIEDPFHPNDIEGWQILMHRLSDQIMIVGDDSCATNTDRIKIIAQEETASGVIIKPNQVGTLIQTLGAVDAAKQAGLSIIASHRSGETNDSFIADLAVGASCGHIKAGAPAHGERLAKYHRIKAIEQMLMEALEDQ